MSIFDDIGNTIAHAAEQVAHEVTGVVENTSVEQIIETAVLEVPHAIVEGVVEAVSAAVS